MCLVDTRVKAGIPPPKAGSVLPLRRVPAFSLGLGLLHEAEAWERQVEVSSTPPARRTPAAFSSGLRSRQNTAASVQTKLGRRAEACRESLRRMLRRMCAGGGALPASTEATILTNFLALG